MTTQNQLEKGAGIDVFHALYIDVIKMEVSEIVLSQDENAMYEAIGKIIGCKVLGMATVLPNNDVL